MEKAASSKIREILRRNASGVPTVVTIEDHTIWRVVGERTLENESGLIIARGVRDRRWVPWKRPGSMVSTTDVVTKLYLHLEALSDAASAKFHRVQSLKDKLNQGRELSPEDVAWLLNEAVPE